MSKIRVLWIEDASDMDLESLAGFVNNMPEYYLRFALNVTQGLERIENESWDIVIVDIRIPPGRDRRWIDLYSNHGGFISDASLGLHLLYSLCKHPDADIPLKKVPPWLTPKTLGVLTVEPNLQVEMEKLGIKTYFTKKATMSTRTLLDVIESVVRRGSKESSDSTI